MIFRLCSLRSSFDPARCLFFDSSITGRYLKDVDHLPSADRQRALNLVDDLVGSRVREELLRASRQVIHPIFLTPRNPLRTPKEVIPLPPPPTPEAPPVTGAGSGERASDFSVGQLLEELNPQELASHIGLAVFSPLEDELLEAHTNYDDDTFLLVEEADKNSRAFETLIERAEVGIAMAIKGLIVLSEIDDEARLKIVDFVYRRNTAVCSVLQGLEAQAVGVEANRSQWGLEFMGLVAASGHPAVQEVLIHFASRWLDATYALVILRRDKHAWAEETLRKLTFENQITIAYITPDEAMLLLKTLRELGNPEAESLSRFLVRTGVLSLAPRRR